MSVPFENVRRLQPLDEPLVEHGRFFGPLVRN
jgi:hypothetical protein